MVEGPIIYIVWFHKYRLIVQLNMYHQGFLRIYAKIHDYFILFYYYSHINIL